VEESLVNKYNVPAFKEGDVMAVAAPGFNLLRWLDFLQIFFISFPWKGCTFLIRKCCA